jgi:phage shock protein E
MKKLKMTLVIFFIVTNIYYSQANEDKTSIWIDVRTAEEYQSGHVEGSVNIPYDEIAERIFEVSVDLDADIRVYCRSGRRSGIAKDVLESLGFTAVKNEGGFEEIKARRAGKQ